METVCRKLRRVPSKGGFRFDVIVGISRGGIIAADMINRKFQGEKPLLCLWADYKTEQPDSIVFESDEARVNEQVVKALDDKGYNSILVVDDVTRRGKTIISAVDLIKKRYPGKKVESAVLFVPKEHKQKVNYAGVLVDGRDINMPYSVLD